MRRHHEALPGRRRRQRRRRLRLRGRRGPRAARRERRRQVDPVERPHRPLPPRRRPHRPLGRARRRCTRPATPSPRASAWCTSTSAWSSRSPSPRTSSSASAGRSAARPIERAGRGARRRATACRSIRRRRSGSSRSASSSASRSSRRSPATPGVLILDEPTAVLTPQEAEVLFDDAAGDGRRRARRRLHLPQARRGDGGLRPRHRAARRPRRRHGATSPTRRSHELARADGRARRRAHADAAPAAGRRRPDAWCCGVDGLRADDDRGQPRAATTSTSTVHAGEIVGVVRRGGQRPARAGRGRLRGCGARTAGTVDGRGGTDRRRRPARGSAGRRRPRARGPAPHRPGGVAERSRTTWSLKSYRRPPSRSGPFLRRRPMRARAATLIERFDVKAPGRRRRPTRLLSGGNVQKVLLARELIARARPCWSPPRRPAGSTSARSRPCATCCSTGAATGVGVLLISEDLDEALDLADRIAGDVRGAHRRRGRPRRRRTSASRAREASGC